MIKSRKMGVASRIPEKRAHLEDLGIEGRIMLKWV
jgi:hypothetical protein